MYTFRFDKEKYGFELLMDLHRLEDEPKPFFLPEVHTTDFFEVLIFEKGQGSIDLNGHFVELQPRTVCFLSPFQKKRCAIDIDSLKGFHLVFQNDFLSEFFEDKLFSYRMQYFYNTQHPQCVQLSETDYPLLQNICNEIVNEIEHYQNDSAHLIRSLLYFALSKLNRLYAQTYALPTESYANSVVYQFKEVLEKNFKQKHLANDYCELLHIERHKLNALTKNYLGQTVKEAIEARLLQEIRSELRYSQHTIAMIADHVGINEANNLTRFFKRMTGISPSAYRKHFQNDSFS